MTGIKIALATVGAIGGISSMVTGTIVANVPSISNETPVSLTLGLIFIGVIGTASAAWKVSRAWSKMETEVTLLRSEVTSLKKSRSATIAAKLRAYEAQLEAEEPSGREG